MWKPVFESRYNHFHFCFRLFTIQNFFCSIMKHKLIWVGCLVHGHSRHMSMFLVAMFYTHIIFFPALPINDLHAIWPCIANSWCEFKLMLHFDFAADIFQLLNATLFIMYLFPFFLFSLPASIYFSETYLLCNVRYPTYNCKTWNYLASTLVITSYGCYTKFKKSCDY